LKVKILRKLILSLSLIGGIWFIILVFTYTETILAPWGEWIPTWPSFLIVGVICIIGFVIEFKVIKVGHIILLIAGITNVILNFIFIIMFVYYIGIPTILVLIVGILALKELIRKNND
jgi:hypothetical protein